MRIRPAETLTGGAANKEHSREVGELVEDLEKRLAIVIREGEN